MEPIFINYVRENADIIEKICASLKRENIPYWIDREKINPGKLWKTSIREAIKKGSLFIACFSNESVNKSESVMNEELTIATDVLRKKQFDSGWLIPIKLNKCTIPDIEIGGGRHFSDIQYIELYPDFSTGVERLIDYIKNKFDLNDKKEDEYYKRMEDIYNQYKAYKALIDNCDGEYFHNGDLGHPVYMAGAYGKPDGYWKYADSKDNNYLFKKLSSLTQELKKNGIEKQRYIWWYDFSDWQSFCLYVIKTYRQKMGYKDIDLTANHS